MMTKNADKKREQIQMFCMDDMVPQNHMLRLIDKAINWNFIYELVEEKYSPDNAGHNLYLYHLKKYGEQHHIQLYWYLLKCSHLADH